MKVKIGDIEYYLPKKIVTNKDLQKENPYWDMKLVEERTGVVKRHIAANNETALDMAAKSCKKLFSRNKKIKRQVDGIIFCTQSPDYIMPPNSCILHKLLELPENVFCLDFNLACSGYVYGLALAKGLIQSGMNKNILLVTGDSYSKYIHQKDRSARVLFGDGASISWISPSNSREEIIDIKCSTYGNDYNKFIIPAGGSRMPKTKKTAIPKKSRDGNIRTLENIHMDGMGILAFVNSRIPKQIRDILSCNKLKIEDIDLFVFHQASKLVLDSLTRLLRIDPGKVYTNLDKVGNTVSSSIPMALKSAMEEHEIKKEDIVLISGFGVGLSWGTAIVRF